MITKLDQIVSAVQNRGKRRIAVAYAEDAHTIQAVNAAVQLGIVDAILIGNRKVITDIAASVNVDLTDFIIQEEQNDVACVNRAVRMVNSGEADIIMKGLVSTDKYMRGILARDGGLVPPRGILSHIAVLELPMYHKLLVISDVAVIPMPDLNQKIAITKNIINCANVLGCMTPKVAILAPTEQMLPGIQSCLDAAIITKMSERGQIIGAIIDGPLALDVAIDPETVAVKRLNSPVGGDADGLVFPNLDAANVFFKAATKLCHAKMALK